MLENKILFVKQKKSKFLTIRHYEGYGYLLRVIYDGTEISVDIEPYDPVFGIGIIYICGRFYLKPPQVDEKDAELLKRNIADAQAFCAEFRRRKNELLKVPS